MTVLISFQAGVAFQNGWKGFCRNAGTLIGFTLLATIVMGLLTALGVGLISAVGENSVGALVLLIGFLLLQAIVSLVISIALLDGSLQSVRGRSLGLSDLFSKITEVPNLIGMQIFGSLAVGLGFASFIIPGIYLAIAYVFAGMALVDKPKTFVDALNISRRLVTRHFFDVTLFLLTVLGVIYLGFLACGVGLFVSVPVGFCLVAAGYQQLIALGGESDLSENQEL